MAAAKCVWWPLAESLLPTCVLCVGVLVGAWPMQFWEAALHGLMNGFENPKIKAYIEELKRSLVNEYFGETERMF